MLAVELRREDDDRIEQRLVIHRLNLQVAKTPATNATALAIPEVLLIEVHVSLAAGEGDAMLAALADQVCERSTAGTSVAS